jgi:hypothetical protein
MKEQMREAFELIVKNTDFGKAAQFNPFALDDRGNYFYAHVNLAYDVYQAALSAVPAQPTKTITELKEGLFGWAENLGGMDDALAIFAERVLQSQAQQPAQEPVISDDKIIEIIKAVNDDVRECNTGGFVLIDTIRLILQAQQPALEPHQIFRNVGLEELFYFQEATGCSVSSELAPHQLKDYMPAQEPVKQESKPEYTFDELTKLTMVAATKEGHKVTMKIKWAQP